MSRIGKQPIPVPGGVDIQITADRVEVKGKLGTLSETLVEGISVAINDNVITLTRKDDTPKSRALHGLMRSLIQNMVVGVSEGYRKTLDMVGVGYRARAQGNKLVVSAGYSHDVEVDAPEGVTFQVDGETAITVSGYSKQQVGQVAADIRAIRKPEPYKGKGIKYREEIVRRKAGKTGKA